MKKKDREPIIRQFLTNLAKEGAKSTGTAIGGAVGGAAAGPIGMVIGAMGGAIIDQIAERYRDKPDVKDQLVAIQAENAAHDIQQLKQLLIKAAGVVDDRTELEKLAVSIDSPERAPDEPLLREAVSRLFNAHDTTTPDPIELGTVIQNITNNVHAKDGVPIGSIHDVETVNIKVTNSERGDTTESSEANELALKASTSKLPTVGQHFVGRDERMTDLDTAWADQTLNVLSLVADGGVGKTSLLVHWLTRFAQNGFRGAERVFAWSFYSQGTSDQASAEPFINDALAWFGDTKPTKELSWAKGERLAQLVRRHRTLLILDGFEPMQHPEEQLDGAIREQSLQALVKELASHNPGLLLITTRLKIAGLDSFQGKTADRIDLEMLSPQACIELFNALDVNGSDDEKKEAAEHFNRHALSIQLLGNFLANRYDDKDIRHWKEVSLLRADKWDRNHATKVMQTYEKWFADENRRAELAYLRIIGLFNRPASKAEIDALLDKPAIGGLTDALFDLTESDRLLALKHLRDMGLFLPKDENAPDTLDAHPLIREHFGQRLCEENESAWRAGHSRLFNHLTGPGCDNEYPDTLEEMTPLYAAISHGCKAGRQQEALDDIFSRRIRRRNGQYSLRQLGAFSSDLAALASFFNKPWSSPAGIFDEPDQGWLLNYASFCLRASGRFDEAEAPMRASLQSDLSLATSDEENRDFHLKQAAISAGNLSQLLLTLGRIDESIRFAEQSVEHADASGDESERMIKRTTLADALDQAGRMDEAHRLFRQAEELQEHESRNPLLYSLRGFLYCDLQLEKAKRADTSESIRNAAVEVHQRATTTLVLAQQSGDLLSIALDYLTLGRSTLLEFIHGGDAIFAKVAAQIETAVDKLREAGSIHHIPRGLLARAALHRVAVEHGDNSSIADAEHDLDETIDIATRDAANGGTLKLHLCDAYLEYARLRLAQGQPDVAHDYFKKTETLVSECGYHRRDFDLDQLRAKFDELKLPSS